MTALINDEAIQKYQDTVRAAVIPDYFLPEQFCNSGVQSIDYVIPPVSSADPAAASLETGAPLLQQVRPSLGGAVFPRQQYNGALRLLSNILTYLNKGREFTFDEKNTDGYALDAVLYDYASKRYVVSLHDANTANFVTNPTLINGTDWKFITVTPEILSSLLAAKANLSGAAFTGAVSVLGVATQGQGIIASGSNANGWWDKSANGLIRQWGRLDAPQGTTIQPDFPIVFTNFSSIVVTGSLQSGNINSAYAPGFAAANLNSFYVTNNMGSSGANSVSWQAEGY